MSEIKVARQNPHSFSESTGLCLIKLRNCTLLDKRIFLAQSPRDLSRHL